MLTVKNTHLPYSNFSISMSSLTCFLFLLTFTPYVASLNFSFPIIGPENYKEIVTTGGGAYISVDGIQVTPDFSTAGLSNKSPGRATYFRPLHLWDKNSTQLASFSTSFTFLIYNGNGLTFFLAENRSMLESDVGDDYGGGAMGLPVNQTTNRSNVSFVAVEFDTFYDPQWDPTNYTHVGININNLSSVSYAEWAAGIYNGIECHASINYDSVSKNLSVLLICNDYSSFIKHFAVDYTIDLKDVLPEWVIFGFSAAGNETNYGFQKNNVKSWTFHSSTLHIDLINNISAVTPRDSVKGKKGIGYIVGLIAGGSLIFALLVIVTIVCWKKWTNKGDEMEEPGSGVEMNTEFEMSTGARRFSYRVLARSTGGFAGKEKLGEGGFGEVYKGFLEDSKIYVAVKRVSKNSKQGIKEYASEVKIISRLRHKNLVQLTGWCHEKGELLLVYEFMENGSLDLHLFTQNNLLAWGTRYKIAHGLASALLYLHEEWEQCVLHRDIKSSNVMLDSNFNAKLGDFGLAKLVDHEKGSQTTLLAGTLGYLAPECVVTGKATRESDVFSFGVVALEIACGRKPIVYMAQENQIRLVEWVWGLYGTGTILEATDPRLGSDYEREEITRLMIIGLWCVHPNPDLRPSMRQVIQVLNSEASLPTLPSKMPVASYLSSPMSSPMSSSYGVASLIQNQSSSSASKTGSLEQKTISTVSSDSPHVSLLLTDE
ncbi:hypothetical protein LXL04_017237 [Taraxacum kok-saghyz]